MLNPFRYQHSVRRCSALLLLVPLFVCSDAKAQSPTLDAIDILPPAPISTSDTVRVDISGTVNDSGSPTFHRFWRRTGADILVDLVDLETGSLAPPDIRPYVETAEIGSLPAGDYDLTVRLFYEYRIFDYYPIPDPWDFPDSFGRSFGIEPGPLTLSSSFTVVPEPSSIVLGTLSLGIVVCRCRRFHEP